MSTLPRWGRRRGRAPVVAGNRTDPEVLARASTAEVETDDVEPSLPRTADRADRTDADRAGGAGRARRADGVGRAAPAGPTPPPPGPARGRARLNRLTRLRADGDQGPRPDHEARTRMLARYRAELSTFGHRSRATVLLCACVGSLTGALVAVYAGVGKRGVFEAIYSGPWPVQVGAPVAALVLSYLALRVLTGSDDASTSDEYIKNVHEPATSIPLKPAPGRLVASWLTLSLGGGCGFEAPSIYLGAVIGTFFQRRLRRFFTSEEGKALMAAGAAAGVAAVFKAPATGAIFAVEVPYRDDMARRLLLPALVGSASGYVADVLITGTKPLFPIGSAPRFDLRDLGGAALVGLAGGFGARLFAAAIRWCKRFAHDTPAAVHVGAGCAVLAGLAVLTRLVYGQPFSLGDGEHAIEWVLDPKRGLGLVLLLLGVRAAATVFTLGGGGAGGLFVPLVVEGALLGRAIGSMIGSTDTTLFAVLGVAAFLGAGYRVPLAAIMFVAETTGRPGFIVPGLIAAVVAELCMGTSVMSLYQTARPRGHLEARMDLPVATVLDAEVATLPPMATVAELFTRHIVGRRQRVVCVIDEAGQLLGLVGINTLSRVEQADWASTAVGDVVNRDVPSVGLRWTIGRALALMEETARDVLPVTDGDGRFAGVVRLADVLELSEILDQARPGTEPA